MKKDQKSGKTLSANIVVGRKHFKQTKITRIYLSRNLYMSNIDKELMDETGVARCKIL
jgi:hypothetical protein